MFKNKTKFLMLIVIIILMTFQINVYAEETANCSELTTIVDIAVMLFGYIKIIVPVLLIVFGMGDFVKAVVAANEDAIKKAQSRFVKRLIAGIAIFFIPTLIELLFSFAPADLFGNGLCGVK
jgi:hypothetical protein